MDPGQADFDPEDKYCWYFGPLSRDETNEILSPSRESGVFLVRESQSMQGDYVLCVKEDNKISHYIINKIQSGSVTRFRIGDQEFTDIPSLLNFYKTHYLDTTSLIRPAERARVLTKFEFTGKDPEDLPFQKNEILEIISKDEKDWWTCRNSHNRVGQIPVNYVVKYDPNSMPPQDLAAAQPPPQYTVPNINPLNAGNVPSLHPPTNNQISHFPSNLPKLPAKAIVVLDRVPNLYDKTQLKLEKGKIVIVTKMNPDGQWEGECNGQRGIFPFTHVKFQDENSPATQHGV